MNLNQQKSVSISVDFADALASSGLFRKLGDLKLADDTKRYHSKPIVKQRDYDSLKSAAGLEPSVSQAAPPPGGNPMNGKDSAEPELPPALGASPRQPGTPRNVSPPNGGSARILRDLSPIESRTRLPAPAAERRSAKKHSRHPSPVPPSRVPERYHKIERYPVLPIVGSTSPVPDDEDETVVYKDNVFYKTWFPSARPADRREVAQLGHTFDLMLQECEQLPPALRVEKEQKVYDVVLHELMRQVSVECADRGALLDRVARRYVELFSRVPGLLHELLNEVDSLVDTNKSLRVFLERLMLDKNALELQLAEIREQLGSVQQQEATFFNQARELHAKLARAEEERDAALADARAKEDALRAHEMIIKNLQQKSLDDRALIKSLTEQLDEAVSRIRLGEPKSAAEDDHIAGPFVTLGSLGPPDNDDSTPQQEVLMS